MKQTHKKDGLLPTITLFQWDTRVYEEIFDSSNNTKYLKFYCWKFEPTGNGKLWRLALRFHTRIWISGPKIWSPLDYPRELTALYMYMHKFTGSTKTRNPETKTETETETEYGIRKRRFQAIDLKKKKY